MFLPENNESRSHDDVNADRVKINQALLDRICDAHDAIAGSTYDGKTTPWWVASNLEKIANFRADVTAFETSDLLRVYFTRAKDGGARGREGVNFLREALANYETQVRLAKGSCLDDDHLRPTGGGLARRTGPNELVTVGEERHYADQRFAGTRNGPFRQPVGGDGGYDVTVRRTFDNSGRGTSTSYYFQDIHGRPYRR